MTRPTIGLALGSGGLRGLAHIGVLKILEREGISVDYIAGCSIGSLIGSLYASGLDSETIFKLAKNLKRRHWIDFVIPKMGLVAGDRTLETIKLLTRRKNFDELAIPLAVVAADLNTGEEVVFRDGEVAHAVRASISVPGVFVPYEYNGRLLIDGAVVNPTPMDVVHSMGADIVIAVDLVPTGEVAALTNIFDIIIQTIDIVERQLLKQRQHYSDLLIKPDVGHISPSSFTEIDECVDLGARAMEAGLPRLRNLLADKQHKAATGENPGPRAATQG
ncbi:patatin-like phospholipase family protein [Anaeroselena agilis]|uniref:Patatin-like phospholipase family protein n=1 Tax=Anaeroselena agilis TaxID=3063788 RepID=A0ABU3NWP0_9FIRM|nr:patatin-like phospholipase family protein [Selenomonadales bacterium 4137-cl]